MNILKFPLIGVCVLFILGIIIEEKVQIIPNYLFLIVIILFIISGIVYFITRNKIFQFPYFGLCISLVALTVGMLVQANSMDQFRSNHYIHYLDDSNEVFARGIINEELKATAKYYRYIVQVKELNGKDLFGDILLNISRDSIATSFSVGDQVALASNLYQNKSVAYPFQFDYGLYLKRKNIYAQTYVFSSNQISKLGHKTSLISVAAAIREKMINNLRQSGFNERELQVVHALILGQQQHIAPDIVKDYQYAGAVHILSVSGLHVGILALSLNFLLKNIYNTKLGRLTKLIILISVLLFFAVLAGLSSPVVRSVVMFSFIAIANYIRRPSNIFNTIVISVLVILLWKPSFIFDVGFQLSYAAVIFIVWLQPIMKSWFTFKYTLVNYFYSILTVSFAAQLGTLPISLYYFHQFPALFFITNLIILPALGAIMILGVIVLILASFNCVISWLNNILEISIYLLNKVINVIASFEGFVLQNIAMTFWMLIGATLLVFYLGKIIENPSYRLVMYGLCCMIILQIVFIIEKLSLQGQNEISFFSKNNCSQIVERSGDRIHFYYSGEKDSLPNISQDVHTYANYYLSEIEGKIYFKNFLEISGTRLFILDKDIPSQLLFTCDILWIKDSPKINFARILAQLQPKLIIVDANNKRYLVNKWEETAVQKQIPFHSLKEMGWFVFSF